MLAAVFFEAFVHMIYRKIYLVLSAWMRQVSNVNTGQQGAPFPYRVAQPTPVRNISDQSASPQGIPILNHIFPEYNVVRGDSYTSRQIVRTNANQGFQTLL